MMKELYSPPDSKRIYERKAFCMTEREKKPRGLVKVNSVHLIDMDTVDPEVYEHTVFPTIDKLKRDIRHSLKSLPPIEKYRQTIPD